MTLEQRPGVLAAGSRRERLRDSRIDSGRERTEKLLLGRIEEVDPAGAHDG
ncbi:hypothetical protein BH20ACT14_BH20ACT14_02320 [soil metagenome]